MVKAFKLTFLTDQSKNAIITVPFAKNATANELKTAMDRIIATQIINLKAGKLLSKENAELIETTYTEFLMQ